MTTTQCADQTLHVRRIESLSTNPALTMIGISFIAWDRSLPYLRGVMVYESLRTNRETGLSRDYGALDLQ